MYQRLRLVVAVCATLACLLPQNAWAQLTANFTYTPASPVCPGDTVFFTDMSTGSPVSWFWNIGTVGGLTGPNVAWSFWAEGSYPVTLTVFDGTDTSSFTQTIVVDGPDFDYSQYSLTATGSANCAPLTVDLVYTGALVGNWVWDMGDGTVYPGNLTTLTHTYTSPGLYQSTITIDDNGCVATYWLDSLFVNQGICLDATVSDVQCNPPSLGAIDLTVNGGTPPYTFTWSNGATTEDLTGLTEGVYSVTVSDAAGSSTTEAYLIDNSQIDLNFTMTPANCQGIGGSLSLSINGGAAPYSIVWSTGDTGVTSLTNLAAGGYSVTVTDANGCSDHDPVFVLFEDSCQINLSGLVYFDANQNCSYDPGLDAPMQGSVVLNDTSWYFAFGTGQYNITTQPGPIELEAYNLWGASGTSFIMSCPPSGQHFLPFQTTDSTGLNFGFQTDTTIYDLSIYQFAGPVRPGFNNWVDLTVCNQGTVIDNPVVTWTHDTAVTFVGATPPATSYDPITRTATWVLPPLGPTLCAPIDITTYADPTTPLGLLVTHLATVSGDSADVNPGNNADTTIRITTGSYDPNDKLVSPAGLGRSGNVDLSTDWFTYTIRFQNTGTDTAFYVTIRDTLDVDFQSATVQPLGSSHPYTLTIGKGGDMSFFFDWILLPDSSTDLEGSQGFVSYRVRRNPDMGIGEQLSNRAAIYFDFNAPIITNTTINTLIQTTSVQTFGQADLRVYPNPSQGILHVRSQEGGLQALRLMNLAGQQVRSMTPANGQEAVMNLHELPAGSYLLQVETSTGRGVYQVLLQHP